eukprot:4300069-Pleurochrysis_carterae.AAC.1
MFALNCAYAASGRLWRAHKTLKEASRAQGGERKCEKATESDEGEREWAGIREREGASAREREGASEKKRERASEKGQKSASERERERA